MGGDLLFSILHQMQAAEVLLVNLQENVTIIRSIIVYPVNSGNGCTHFVFIGRIHALKDFGERVGKNKTGAEKHLYTSQPNLISYCEWQHDRS